MGEEGAKTYDFNTRTQRLLAQNMQIGFNCLDSLLSMYSRHGCDDYSLQAFLLEHLVIVLIQAHAKWFQMLLCPLDLSIIWCARSYELCSWCAIEEMKGVAFAHASEAGASDSELLRWHFERKMLARQMSEEMILRVLGREYERKKAV